MRRNFQEYLDGARAHYESVLEEKISALAELTQVSKERFIKINPMDFIATISGFIEGGESIVRYINKYKTPDTFLISPLDSVRETANQIRYKTFQVDTKIRAHKCDVVPIPQQVAASFYVRNHRQTAATISERSVNFALVYGHEIVAAMTYDLTAGAVRGRGRAEKYELLRLAIKRGTQVNGGASKLQKACESALLELGHNDIFSYSNATINEGGVYEQLGFKRGKIDAGRAFVVMPDYSLCSLATFSSKYGSGNNATLRRFQLCKVNLGGNRVWVKHLESQGE